MADAQILEVKTPALSGMSGLPGRDGSEQNLLWSVCSSKHDLEMNIGLLLCLAVLVHCCRRSVFRQFKWLLNDAQLNDVDRWIQKALVDAKGRMSSRKALEDNKKSRPTPAMSSAGSSKDPAPTKRKNSDGVAAEVDGKTAKTPKEAVTEDDVICEEPSGASGLLSFFGAKAL